MGTALIEVLGRSALFPLWSKQVTVMLLPLTGNRLVDTACCRTWGSCASPPDFGPTPARPSRCGSHLPPGCPSG